MITLQGKNIVISGASSGIGRACAIMAAQLGAHVILLGRDEDKLRKTHELMGGNPLYHMSLACDITQRELLEPVIQNAFERFGTFSGFIHSAGITSTVPLRNMNSAKYEQMFAINVIAAFELARLIANKKVLCPDGGSFVFISSVRAILGEPGAVAYSSSKAALLGGARSMALELAQKRVRVNCILPGNVCTEMTEDFFKTIPTEAKETIIKSHPLGLGQPEDVAHLCMFLLSDLSRWITGTSIPIDGGYCA